jgi:hypothetical protein
MQRVQKVGLTGDGGNALPASRKQSAQGSKGGEEPVSDGANGSSPTLIAHCHSEAARQRCLVYRLLIPLINGQRIIALKNDQ